jgi:hypothetical protein
VVFPSKRPWSGSFGLFVVDDDGESGFEGLLTFAVNPSWLASKERAVSPFAKPVIFVKELFGVRRSSMLYLK